MVRVDQEARARIRRIAEQMRRVPTLEALRRASFWEKEGDWLRRTLQTVQTGGRASASAGAPRRVVHWNILKGIAFDQISRLLREHEALRDADVILLNEVDVGMARSGNRHVARELAHHLGCAWAYVPSYLELTKGPGQDADAPGENRLGFHGVACLTRIAPLACRAIPLPESFDAFAFSEKRYGQRTALLVHLPGDLLVGTVHCEVRGTPAGRAAQVACLVDGVDRFSDERGVARVLLSGDLNTHTFHRGTLGRSLRGFIRLVTTPSARLQLQFLEPWQGGREMLFDALRQAGFEVEALSDGRPTAWAPLATIEESGPIPAPLRRCLVRWVEGDDPRGRPLRLDWFMGRGVTVRGPARTVASILEQNAPSDHAPLVLELAR